MPEPKTLVPKPSLVSALLGGTLGVLILCSLLYVSPAIGFPDLEVPLLMGSVLTGDPQAAFWLGHGIFILAGIFVFPPLLAVVLWSSLPGDPAALPGVLLKGFLWGLVLWVASGLALPLIGLLSQFGQGGMEGPGLFAHRAGLLGVLGLFGGHVVYGVVLGLLLWAGQGLSPLDALGWEGIGKQGARHEPVS